MKRHFILLALAICILQGGAALAQKRVSILGDSYSTFKEHVTPKENLVWYPAKDNDVVKLEQTWWHQFIHNYGYTLEVNNSYSGSTICNTGYRKEDYSDRSFITRMGGLGNPDIIFIFGATNDSWAGAPIGEYKYDSWTSQELYSFRPALAYLLSGLQSRYPQARVYYLLNSELKGSINESVYTICQRYDVPVITLYNIEKQRNHPSIAGMKAISEQVHAFLEKEAEQNQFKALKSEMQEIKMQLEEIKRLIQE